MCGPDPKIIIAGAGRSNERNAYVFLQKILEK